MALLEENSRVFSAVHKRLHNSQKQEFKLIAKLNGIYLPDRYPYRVGTDDVVFRADFDSRIDIIPVSDPATFSSTQRISQAQAMLQMSKEAPDIHNKFKAYRRMYDALRIPNYDEILIDPDSAVRQDAVAENVAIMKQRPIKVFEDQDHMAHITVLRSRLICSRCTSRCTRLTAVSTWPTTTGHRFRLSCRHLCLR